MRDAEGEDTNTKQWNIPLSPTNGHNIPCAKGLPFSSHCSTLLTLELQPLKSSDGRLFQEYLKEEKGKPDWKTIDFVVWVLNETRDHWSFCSLSLNINTIRHKSKKSKHPYSPLQNFKNFRILETVSLEITFSTELFKWDQMRSISN